MDDYPYPIPANYIDLLTPDRTDGLVAWLAAQVPPITVESVTVMTTPRPTLVIRADADPRPLMVSWVPSDSEEATKTLQAITFLQTYIALVEAWDASLGPAPTASQVAHAVAANVVVLRSMAKQLGLTG